MECPEASPLLSGVADDVSLPSPFDESRGWEGGDVRDGRDGKEEATEGISSQRESSCSASEGCETDTGGEEMLASARR